MMRVLLTRSRLAGAFLISCATVGCGGSQHPAESPEASPAPASPDADKPPTEQPAPEGEHTMPDGTKMPGHDHGDHEPAPEPPKKQ